MAIVMLTVLGIISGVGFLVSWMEVWSVRTHEAGTRAYHLAESGLAMALVRPGLPSATRVFNLTGGTATVTAEPIMDVGAAGRLTDFTSRGTVVDRGGTATRSVSRVAWVSGPPLFDAALSIEVTSSPGTVTAGVATGTISGLPAAGCARPGGAGVVAAGAITPGAVAVTGTPAVVVPPPTAGATRRTGLRWADVLSGAAGTPDATVPGDPWPPSSSGWSYIRLRASGPLGPGHSGRGVIVAEGDLDLANGFAWRGLLLVGGTLTLFGDVDVDGAVFAGLDPRKPGAVYLGDGVVRVAFDRCAADRAARRLEPYPAALPGTWREAW